MNEQNAVLIINAIINKENMSEVQTYLSSIAPVFDKNGGRPIARYKTLEQLAGEESPEMIALFEFPSSVAIKEMIEGGDFKALADIRAKAFSKLNLMICDPM